MNLFSHRKGLKPIKTSIQIDSMDNDLRNKLWNGLSLHVWDSVDWQNWSRRNIGVLVRRIWHSYFKLPLDEVPQHWTKALTQIRQYFFECPWNEVYDLLEFIALQYEEGYNEDKIGSLIEFENNVLENEVSAYRFVDRRITQITSEVEIAEIEEALAGPLKPVNAHLRRALDLLADKKTPDYRNSIKESISAVEAVCKLISKNGKASLGEALKALKDDLHPALRKSFDALYGYTSDEQGVRHALLDESKLNFADAKFMLVSCSAFINYLIAIAGERDFDL
jgi:hypothetical protein